LYAGKSKSLIARIAIGTNTAIAILEKYKPAKIAAAAVGVKHHAGWPLRPATPIAIKSANTSTS
jgi:hypothetical protein